MSIQNPPRQDSSSSSYSLTLPGPPSRSNGTSTADLHPSNLLAYPSGSTVTLLHSPSLQLISSLPLPPPPNSPLSPFLTSLRWSPQSSLSPLSPSLSSPLLAAGDRQGRIALLRPLQPNSPILFLHTNDSNSNNKSGIQDLCWIQTGPDSFALAAISGPSLLSLYNTNTNRCFFRYDASPEYLSCLRRDPFDPRRFSALGLKGFLLSVLVHGDQSENDVVVKDIQIPTDSGELQRLERDHGGRESNSSASAAPAMAVFPTYVARMAYSPRWRHVVFVTFPREFVVFDLQYGTALFSTGLPRGCGKFVDVVPDPSLEVVYCLHLDGRLSAWRRKE